MANPEKVSCAMCELLGLNHTRPHSHPKPKVKVSPEDLLTKQFIGEALDLGQKCPECPERHYCDAICTRFSPRAFKCLGCGQYQKHRKMNELLASFKENKRLSR